MVAIRAKEAFQPVFEVTTTCPGSGIVIIMSVYCSRCYANSYFAAATYHCFVVTLTAEVSVPCAFGSIPFLVA